MGIQPYSPFLLQHNREMARIRENQQQFAQQQQVAKQKQDIGLAGNLARGILSATDENKQKSYTEALRMYSEQGGDINGMPTSFTKEVIPMLEQMSAMSPAQATTGDSQLDYLKEGFDPTRLGEEGYIQERLEKGSMPESNTEFAYNISEMRRAGVDEETIQGHIADRVATQAKGFDTLRGQTIAKEEPKLQLQQQYQPTTEGLKEEAKKKAQLEYEPQIKVATATAEAKRKGKQELRKAKSSYRALSKNVERIQTTLDENPELFGIYSKPLADLSQATKGAKGFTKEQMEKRGGVMNQVTQAGLQMLGLATEAGLSGINTVEEAKRVIGELTPDASAEAVKGALDALQLAKQDLLTELQSRFGEQEEEPSASDIEAELKRRGVL